MRKDMRIIMMAPWLPKLSETFVYREVFGLRESGIEVLPASVHHPGTDWNGLQLRALAEETIQVYGKGTMAMLLDAVKEAARHPVISAATLKTAVQDALKAEDVSTRKGRFKILWQGLGGLALAGRSRGHRPEHIHAHMAHVPTTIAMYAAMQLGIGFSFTGHAADIFRDRSLLKQKLERAGFVRCISYWHREFYKGIVDRSDAEYPVVRCGVDTAETGDAQKGHDGSELIIGVGRLVPKKGFDLLLRALQVLQSSGRDCRCRIIGDGPERANLESLAASLGLQDVVTFEGSMDNTDILEMLPQADIFALPCRLDATGDKDGIPVVLMEAMAAGICCVSGDLPTIRELITSGENGWLVPPEDINALAETLELMLKDPRNRQSLAGRGRRRILEEFSLEINVQRLKTALLTQQSV